VGKDNSYYLPHPLSPPLLSRRGGINFERGAGAPLKHPRLNKSLSSRGKEVLERGLSPLSSQLPLPLIKGKGDKGG